jgi:hypothetical protein
MNIEGIGEVTMAVEYTQTAIDKLMDSQYLDLREIIQLIPEKKLQNAIKILPKEKGFRPGKDTDIRLQKYIARLKRGIKEDWSLMLELWLIYTESHAVFSKVIEFQNRKELEQAIERMLSSVDFLRESITKLVQVAHTENLTQEVLSKWLLFSPFEPDEEIDKLIAIAPSSTENSLKARVSIIEKRIATMEKEDKYSKELQRIEKLINKIGLDFSVLSSKSVNNQMEALQIKDKLNQLETTVNNIKQICNKSIDDLSSVRSDLSAVVQKTKENNKNVEEIWANINGNTSRINDLENLENEQDVLSAYVENLQRDFQNKLSALSVSSMALQVDFSSQVIKEKMIIQNGEEIVDLETEPDIISHISNNLNKLGIKRPHAKVLATEIRAALATGQMVIFEGSFAQLIAERCASCLTGGQYILLRIPFGLIESISLEKHLRETLNDIELSGGNISVIIEGLNRSAFEIYGTYLKRIISERILRIQESYDSVYFFGVTVEGPSTVTPGVEILELGPLLSVDSVGWMDKPAAPSIIGSIKREDWFSEIHLQSSDDWEDTLMPDWLLAAGGAMWRRNIIMTETYASLLKESFDNPLEFCLFGWVVPMILQTNTNQIKNLTDYISNDDRLRLLLLKRAPEVINS